MGTRRARGRIRSAAVLLALAGALLTGRAHAASGDWSLVTFDDRITSVPPNDGEPARVSDQYRNDLGVGFHEDTVYAFGAPIDGGLARSGPNALACFSEIDSCPESVGWSFDSPQGWIEAWVGFASGHPDVPILISGFDESGMLVVEARATIPASDGPTPASVPIWAIAESASIMRVRISRPDGTIGSVIVDDVAFAKTTPAPDLALIGPSLTPAEGTIHVGGQVMNVGPVPVDPFTVTIDGPTGTSEVTVGNLDPGQSSILDRTIDLPPGFDSPVAHVRIVAGPDLPIADANPVDNAYDEDVAVILPPQPSLPTEPPATTAEPITPPPTAEPTAEPTSEPTSPAASPTDLPTLLVGAAVVIALVGGAAAGWRLAQPRRPRTVRITGETATESGVKVSIDVDGKDATATIQFDDVTVTVDTGGPASIQVQDGPPPDRCQPLRFGNLTDGQCWYARRQVIAQPGDGVLRAMTIVVVRSAGVEVTVPVEASLVTRIRTLAEASDREAATRAVLRELSEVAANLAGSVDDATRLVVRGRVGWLKVPTKVTLHACLGTGTEGTFRELKPIQHTWDVTRTRDLAGERIASHGDPGDTVARVIARAIDEARRPHRL